MSFFPLVSGGEWIGLVSGQARRPIYYTPPIIRQITSLVDQAATVAQTQRLFEEANSRAQQEQILRQVSERVDSAVDAESVLRTAVTEVGKALGLEAFIYLDEHTAAQPETNVHAETNGAIHKNKAISGSK
jgi:GAF domain-containing protein